ncbi:probable receptor-like protein kinase At1g30570 [Impatiens glandulifera]|uniref:probable receptor-like protein kinase At1g30570 n=1 Tax=Impatiens glandulifera TaxID=253017 RepID=UPI001FB15DB1|nr:probable receptor-like protein kinase At1g30570 [Impatiens glandulifera]
MVIFLAIIYLLFGGAIGETEKNTFLINCGTNGSSIIDGRKWVGDIEPNNNVTLSSSSVLLVSNSSSSFNEDSSLYSTARLFTDNLNYTFRGFQGNYFLRLHFHPISSPNYDDKRSFFSVEANGVKLLSKFNVAGEIQLRKSSPLFLIQEYFLKNDLESLVIGFVPDKGLFGYVNAIEIVPVVDDDSLFNKRVGIQTMYRLNVGGMDIKPGLDELFRSWEVDSGYMLSSEAGFEIENKSFVGYGSVNDTIMAPISVYETARTSTNAQVLEKRFNMSWEFVVDPGFDYLVRLHFCELEFDRENQRKFRIYVNNKTVADNFDVFKLAGGKNRAFHQDFVDSVSDMIDTIWVQLGPTVALGSSESDALLNGLEIFKLGRNGDLTRLEKYNRPRKTKQTKNLILWVGIGAGLATILVIGCLLTLIIRLCKTRKNKPRGLGSVSISGVSRNFTLAEIKAATNNFDEKLILGVGGFGKVYKGEIEEGFTVAIKRANPQSEQGLKEFQTEIQMLSRLRHKHLVSMVGICEEGNEMILVYGYMSNGTLRDHLLGQNNVNNPLNWKQRLEICIGAARGLHYLHTGSDRGIIHRDVKSTNILLDENLVAKMADFGLSKSGPSLDHTHVSTAVKGSLGYLDPEYFRRQQLTEKSDVYSLGVVLLEVVCARPVIYPSLPKDEINLVEWAMKWQREKKLETIIDPYLKGQICPESLEKFGEIVEKCLCDEGKIRPTMGEVLWHLECVLQIHQAWICETNGEETMDSNNLVL